MFELVRPGDRFVALHHVALEHRIIGEIPTVKQNAARNRGHCGALVDAIEFELVVAAHVKMEEIVAFGGELGVLLQGRWARAPNSASSAPAEIRRPASEDRRDAAGPEIA